MDDVSATSTSDMLFSSLIQMHMQDRTTESDTMSRRHPKIEASIRNPFTVKSSYRKRNKKNTHHWVSRNKAATWIRGPVAHVSLTHVGNTAFSCGAAIFRSHCCNRIRFPQRSERG